MELVCKECSKKFERAPSKVREDNFCDRSCMMTWRNKMYNPRSKNAFYHSEYRVDKEKPEYLD